MSFSCVFFLQWIELMINAYSSPVLCHPCGFSHISSSTLRQFWVSAKSTWCLISTLTPTSFTSIWSVVSSATSFTDSFRHLVTSTTRLVSNYFCVISSITMPLTGTVFIVMLTFMTAWAMVSSTITSITSRIIVITIITVWTVITFATVTVWTSYTIPTRFMMVSTTAFVTIGTSITSLYWIMMTIPSAFMMARTVMISTITVTVTWLWLLVVVTRIAIIVTFCWTMMAVMSVMTTRSTIFMTFITMWIVIAIASATRSIFIFATICSMTWTV